MSKEEKEVNNAVREIILTAPITEHALKMLGYAKHVCNYWCAPLPANGGTYRIDFSPQITGPKKDDMKDFKFRAYIPDGRSTTIKWFNNLGELYYLHRAMCGGKLF